MLKTMSLMMKTSQNWNNHIQSFSVKFPEQNAKYIV